jgi:tetratricopeptide (TPR) repeat protein
MIRNIIILILFLGVAPLLLNGCPSEHRLSAEEYLKQGVYFEQSEQYNNAIRTYTKVLEINPRCPEAYKKRGAVWSKKKDFDKAVADFT